MLTNEEYNNYIHIQDNVLSVETCKMIIEKFNNSPRKEPTSMNIHKNIVNSNIHNTLGIVFGENDDEWGDVFELLSKSLDDNLKFYLKKTNFPKLKYKSIFFPYCNVQKILRGGFYGPHIDNFGKHADSKEYPNERIITCIWYLNDVDIGGETHFLETGLKIKPKTGRLTFFPSNHPFVHEGLLTQSTKYIISCWLEVETKSFNKYEYS